MWASDFVFKADLFAREYGDVNPGIPFWPEGGDTANLSASLRLPFQFASGEDRWKEKERVRVNKNKNKVSKKVRKKSGVRKITQ